MATVIKLKRGTSTPTTSDIISGEVAVDTSAKKLYINDSGTIKELGGSASGEITIVDDSSTASTISLGETLKIAGGTNVTTSISGDTLTINSTGSGGAAALGGDVRSYTGDGSTVAFTVSSGADVENVMVFINGVYQRPTTDYTVSSTTLTFGTAPANADSIIIKELVEGGTSLTFVDDSSTTTELSSGSSLKIAGGTGVTTSISGDTLTIAVAAQLTVQEEGSSLSTAASTLNFVGSGVTATGSGATKTITIPGGGGDIFKNIAMPDGSTIVAADSSTDTLTLAQAGLISITGDSSTDTVTVSSVSSTKIPFLKADGSSSDIDLQTSGTIGQVISNLHIPFTIADGTDVTTLVVA